MVTTFQFVGGAPALDFCNTAGVVGPHRRDDALSSFSDLARWARRAGLVRAGDARRLRRLPGTRAVLRRARALREAVYRLFTARVSRRPLPRADLRLLNRELARALARRRVAPAAAWTWDAPPRPDRVLWPVVENAAELLASPAVAGARVCGHPT
jgi:predicted RNA-binding Zn ribbon-like protein